MKVVAMLLMLVGLCSCVNRGPVATITTETGIPMRVTEFTEDNSKCNKLKGKKNV